MPKRVSVAGLLELSDAMRGQRLPMLVDLVADRFLTGHPKRISREAPVLILEHQSERLVPGGGANAVANVRALGGEPLPLGVVGDDAIGEELLVGFAASGINTEGVLRRPGYATPTKTRILGGAPQSIKQQIVRIDRGSPLALSADEEKLLTARIAGLGDGCRVAVVSDYGYGAVQPSLVAPLRRALGPSALIIGDSRHRLRLLRGLDGATPNQEEAEAWLGTALASADEVRRGGARMLSELGGKLLLITRGSRGMALFVTDGDGSRRALLPVFGTDQVADVTGAGDTVIGAFALALAAGAEPLAASLLANVAAGLVVMKMGTATVSAEELRDALGQAHSLVARAAWDESST